MRLVYASSFPGRCNRLFALRSLFLLVMCVLCSSTLLIILELQSQKCPVCGHTGKGKSYFLIPKVSAFIITLLRYGFLSLNPRPLPLPLSPSEQHTSHRRQHHQVLAYTLNALIKELMLICTRHNGPWHAFYVIVSLWMNVKYRKIRNSIAMKTLAATF